MAKIIELRGFVGVDITARELSAELSNANGADVELHVNSPGGLFFAGVEIHNLLRAYKGNVDVLITGVAMSAASYFILPANTIRAYDNATFMIHNARNLAVGDKHDMLKMHSILDGMDSIMANAYTTKSATAVSKIKSLMDAETFYFGDDMKAAGFIDEIIKAPDDDGSTAHDKDTAIVEARALVKGCMDTLRDSEAANSDMQSAVAYMDGMSALLANPPVKPVAVVAPGTINKPAVAGTNKEDKYMSLEVLLADNPAARAEHDAAIAKARAEGEATARDAMKAVVAKVEPILKSTDYPDSVKAFGAQVLTGEKTVDGFEAVVFMEDQRIEAAKAAAAKAESEGTPETPAAAASSDAVADAEAKAKFDEKKKRMEQGV